MLVLQYSLHGCNFHSSVSTKMLPMQAENGSFGMTGFPECSVRFCGGKGYPMSSPLFKRHRTPLSACKQPFARAVVKGVITGGQTRVWLKKQSAFILFILDEAACLTGSLLSLSSDILPSVTQHPFSPPLCVLLTSINCRCMP